MAMFSRDLDLYLREYGNKIMRNSPGEQWCKTINKYGRMNGLILGKKASLLWPPQHGKVRHVTCLRVWAPSPAPRV